MEQHDFLERDAWVAFLGGIGGGEDGFLAAFRGNGVGQVGGGCEVESWEDIMLVVQLSSWIL